MVPASRLRFVPAVLWLLSVGVGVCFAACSAGSDARSETTSGGSGGTATVTGGAGGSGPCVGTTCVGDEVHGCNDDGTPGDLITTCDIASGELCSNGACVSGCQASVETPSNVGCEFYAVDLDLSDGMSDPANAAWGVVLANAGQAPADVVIEQNDAPLGSPPVTTVVHQVTIQPSDLEEFTMPTREVDCAATPGDSASPGTCLSSRAYRITSTVPIVVYQFNNLVHGWSTDASLLLPTSAVGTKYRVTGWPVAHSYPSPGAFVQRSYVTVIGTQPGTSVTVKPSWRIKGNDPVPATAAGDTLTMTLGPFDVLNLESDDATLSECVAMQTAPYCADLTGTAVDATAPVVVFSGTEESGVGLPADAPLPPSWNENSNGCCNQHLEEQLAPVESFGKQFLVTRSPIRSDPEYTTWEEPDIIRFVGAAAPSTVTTNLPAPNDSFTLQPGEVRDTWTQTDFVVTASEPIVVAQLLIGQGYVEPQPKGDPSLTIYPPIEQARTEYVFQSISGWQENWVVVGAETGTEVTIDGAPPAGCSVHAAGVIDGAQYEARRCPLSAGVHRLSGNGPFQIMAYGYADADAYSFPGGANIKKIYEPPPLF
jgi:hypothetical protein